jgi:hypothetical protein
MIVPMNASTSRERVTRILGFSSRRVCIARQDRRVYRRPAGGPHSHCRHRFHTRIDAGLIQPNAFL